MGYYSTFNLSLLGQDGRVDYSVDAAAILESLFEKVEYASYALASDGSPNDSCKWYELDKDMKAFSKEHPSVLFKFEVEGEENGDLYHKYFLNGKMQKAKAEITYPEFDASKLL